MSPEMKLLRQLMDLQLTFMDECGFDVDWNDEKWSVTRRQKKKRTAKEIKYSPEFENAWKLMPSRGSANNPKIEAFGQWKTRLLEGFTVDQLTEGAIRYKKYCIADEVEGTKHVLQARTFYGREHYFLKDYLPPKKKLNKEDREKRLQELKAEPWAQMPGSIDIAALRSFAIEYDYKQPGQVHNINDLIEYKRLLKIQIDARINKEL